MLPVGLEPTISAGERPQTYALDRAATVTGTNTQLLRQIKEAYAFDKLNLRVMVHLDKSSSANQKNSAHFMEPNDLSPLSQ
jgi:hypothetical protein